uniref:Uncharacterized protein n=1 Tax=Tanacetum cinerariifolium TaxID=118510 RepID=A0A6L2NE77_TANCI|nr:hypothetical protein [Tanacetum cinerariifolium]
MHSTMVPEQVKTQKIQAGVQVSTLEDKDVIFSTGSALEDFISCILYLNIIQAVVQVSRLEDKDVIFSTGSALEDFIFLYFVLEHHNGYDIMEMINEELYPTKPDSYVDSNSNVETNQHYMMDVSEGKQAKEVEIQSKEVEVLTPCHYKIKGMNHQMREQISIDEDDQFWKECAWEFDHVEEHRAQDKGLPEDVATGKQPMIEDELLQVEANLPTQECIVKANPKPTRSKKSKAAEVPN